MTSALSNEFKSTGLLSIDMPQLCELCNLLVDVNETVFIPLKGAASLSVEATSEDVSSGFDSLFFKVDCKCSLEYFSDGIEPADCSLFGNAKHLAVLELLSQCLVEYSFKIVAFLVTVLISESSNSELSKMAALI